MDADTPSATAYFAVVGTTVTMLIELYSLFRFGFDWVVCIVALICAIILYRFFSGYRRHDAIINAVLMTAAVGLIVLHRLG